MNMVMDWVDNTTEEEAIKSTGLSLSDLKSMKRWLERKTKDETIKALRLGIIAPCDDKEAFNAWWDNGNGKYTVELFNIDDKDMAFAIFHAGYFRGMKEGANRVWENID